MKNIPYKKFPRKVKSFLEDYFKVGENIFEPLYISFEKLPENYPFLYALNLFLPIKLFTIKMTLDGMELFMMQLTLFNIKEIKKSLEKTLN